MRAIEEKAPIILSTIQVPDHHQLIDASVARHRAAEATQQSAKTADKSTPRTPHLKTPKVDVIVIDSDEEEEGRCDSIRPNILSRPAVIMVDEEVEGEEDGSSEYSDNSAYSFDGLKDQGLKINIYLKMEFAALLNADGSESDAEGENDSNAESHASSEIGESHVLLLVDLPTAVFSVLQLLGLLVFSSQMALRMRHWKPT